MKTITIWEHERPEPNPNPDFSELKDICLAYLDKVEKGDGNFTEDEKHYIFEAAINAIYGEHVWEFINERNG
jgi:hypothetical protein